MIKYLTIFLSIITVTLFAQNTVIPGKIIKGSERWFGTVIIEGDVIIKPGGRLVIEPGTKVLFRAGLDKRRAGRDKTRSELIVRGMLIANGTINAKIRFSSASAQPRMGDWYGISIMNPRSTCIINYCVVEYAYNGINVKKSQPKISSSQIQFNYNAGIVVELKATPKINGNIITENGYAGLICNTGAAPVLTDNLITLNEIGIINFRTARPNLGNLTRGPGYNPGRNSIFDNREYNIHNHSSEELKAENASWGSKDEKIINALIFDAGDDKKYGTVDIKPIMGGGLNLDEKILLSQNTTQPPGANPPQTAPPETRQTNNGQAAANLSPPKAAQEASALAAADQNKGDTTALKKLPEKLPADTLSEKPDSALLVLEQPPAKTQPEKQLQPEEKKEPEIDYNQVFLDAFLDKGRVIKKTVTPVVDDTRRGLGAHGRIIVRVVVGKMGRVESARVLKGLNPYYDQLAMDAAMKFVFEQGTIKGIPVRFSSSLIFEF